MTGDTVAALSWGYGLWLALMALCTIVIIYTDMYWYWISDGIVRVAALAKGAVVADSFIILIMLSGLVLLCVLCCCTLTLSIRTLMMWALFCLS